MQRGRLRLGHNLDFLAGAALVALALLAFWLTSGLRLGTIARMGPGLFPTILIVGLAGVGVAIAVQALSQMRERMEPWFPRPILFVSLSVLVFGIAVEPAGLFPAASLSVIVAALSSRISRPVETIVLALVVSALVSSIFVIGLGLPLDLLP